MYSLLSRPNLPTFFVLCVCNIKKLGDWSGDEATLHVQLMYKGLVEVE